MKVLIVEDEKKVASFIKKGLTSEGYSADLAGDGEEGLFLADDNEYDLIIMDIMLPKMDGITLCKKLRAKKNPTPIIMLSAKDTVEDRVAGLEAGADDYLTKPFSFSELLARLRAVERRSAGSSFGELKVGDLHMNIDAHSVSRGTKDINLSSTEFRLLKFMMENAGKALSKTIILEKVWGYDFSPESNIVDVYIKYLRDKVDKPFKKPLIHTVHSVGYKLCE
jgi:two-component system, OmpR family, response regulator